MHNEQVLVAAERLATRGPKDKNSSRICAIAYKNSTTQNRYSTQLFTKFRVRIASKMKRTDQRRDRVKKIFLALD